MNKRKDGRKMKHQITRLIFISGLVLTLLFNASVLAENSEIAIPEFAYHNFQLDNGLEVYVFEDERIPLVELSIFYKVGSIDEPKGLSGISHFLEHTMFLGTESLPKGEIEKLIKTVGGQYNAITSYDFTYYYSQVPSSMLELVMAIEADRMANLKIDPEDIEREREVIRQERRSAVENNVVSLGLERLQAKAFPASSLNHQVIGWAEDINHISAKDLERYYNTYYVPNNAVMVVAGDVDTVEVKALTEKYFADYKRKEVERPEFVVEKQEDEIGEEMPLPTNVPITLMLYKIPAGDHPDIMAIDIFLNILVSNESSRLKQKLQNEEQIILETGTFLNTLRVPGYALVYYVPNNVGLLEQAQKAFDREVARLINDGIEQEEFQAVKKTVEKNMIFMQRDTETMAANIGLSKLRYDHPDLYIEQLINLSRLTEEDIVELAGKYFVEENRVIGHIVPENN
jgi:zinc protease